MLLAFSSLSIVVQRIEEKISLGIDSGGTHLECFLLTNFYFSNDRNQDLLMVLFAHLPLLLLCSASSLAASRNRSGYRQYGESSQGNDERGG